MTKKQVSI